MGGVRMYKAIKLITEELDRAQLKYRAEETEKLSVIRVGMNNKVGGDEVYYFVADNDRNDVVLRSGTIASIPEEKMDEALEIVNNLNNRFRYARFVIDKDRDVVVQADVPTESTDAEVGPIAVELMVRLSKMYDEVYPQLMKCVWG